MEKLMTTKTPVPTPTASAAKIDLFLDRLVARNAPNGRLIFALDATASRQPTWDAAVELQAEMFKEVASVGGLEIQLVYYRGTECRSSRWMTDAQALGQAMRKIECIGGYTQIRKVLEHARRTHDQTPISTLVFVGDAMEEQIDELCGAANELGRRGVRALVFFEGDKADAEKAFRAIAKATHGAFARFSSGSAQELRDLLRAAAAYAAGGLKALQGKKEATKLLEQLK
jgi:hypothetical protein